jgi:hypothetical protein
MQLAAPQEVLSLMQFVIWLASCGRNNIVQFFEYESSMLVTVQYYNQSQSYITTDSQSVSLSWC